MFVLNFFMSVNRNCPLLSSLLFLLQLLFLLCYIEIFLLHYIGHSPDYPYEG